MASFSIAAVAGPAGNFIRSQNTLQPGATFYVSSGTVTNLQTTTLKFGDGTTQTTAGGAGSSSLEIKEGTTTIATSVSTISFNVNGFDLSTGVNIVNVNLSSPSITRGQAAYFAGDSITYGAGATPSGVNDGYPARISTYFNWAKKILAVASSNVADYAYQIFPGYIHTEVGSGYSSGPTVVTSTDTFVIWGDYNGLRDFGSVASYVTHHENTLKAVAAYAAIPQTSKFTGQSSTVTRTGTWANSPYYGGSLGTQSSTLNSNVSFNAKGKSVYVCMLNFSASTSPYSGGVSGRPDTVGSSFTITIDGVVISTYPNFRAYGNRGGYNGGDLYLPVGLNYAPWLYRIDNLKDTEHSVVVNVSSGHANKPITFLWGTGSGNIQYSPYSGPNVILVNTIRPLLAGGSSLTTESAITDAIDNFHNAQFKVSRELSNDGLRVTYVDTNPYYNKNTASADNVHPNNTGHQQIADAIAYGVSNLENSFRSGNLAGNTNYFPEGIKVSSSIFITTSDSIDIYKQNSTVNDYEKLTIGWEGDVANIEAKTSGSGTAKRIQFKAGNNSEDAFSVLSLSRQSAPPFYVGVPGAAVASAFPEYFKFIVEPSGLQGSSGSPAVIYSSAPVNQSGTAGYDMFRLNVIETTTGSGEKNLIRVSKNSVDKFIVRSDGDVIVTSTFSVNSSTIALNGTTYYWTAGAGSPGQFLTTDGASRPTLTWTTSAGGGGGSSPLGVFKNGVEVSSPTAQINFSGSYWGVNLGGASTATITLIGGSTHYIQNTNILQAGTTFYVSSGTVQDEFFVLGDANIGNPGATSAQLVVKGGASGTDLMQLQRTSGATSTYGFALAGGGLSFRDVTSGFVTNGMYGDGGLNNFTFGVRNQTTTDSRIDRLSAKSFNSGTNINGTEFQIYGSLGTGSGTPGDINFYTGSVGSSGSSLQTGTQRATIKNNTGNFGILTSTPNASLEINSATGANLRLTYNDSDGGAANYADLRMSSGGDLTITSSGGETRISSAAVMLSTVAIANGSYTPGSKVGTSLISYPYLNHSIFKSTAPYTLLDSTPLGDMTFPGVLNVISNADKSGDQPIAKFMKEITIEETTGLSDVFSIFNSSVSSNVEIHSNSSINSNNGTAINLKDSDSSNYVSFRSSETLAYNQEYVLPVSTNVIGSVLAIEGERADGKRTTRWKPDQRQLHIPVANPSAGTYLIGKAINGMTIKSINCVVDPAGTGENTVIQFQECDSNGDSCADVDSGTDITCGNTNTADDGTLSNPSIDANDWYALEIVSVSGTVTQLNITVNYEQQ